MHSTFWENKTSKCLCTSIQSFFQLAITLACSCSWLDGGRLLADTRGRFDLPLALLTAEYLRKGFSARQPGRESPGTQQELSTQKCVKAHKHQANSWSSELWNLFKAVSESHLCVHITFLWFFFFILFTRLTVASLSLTRSHTSIPHMTTFRVYPSTHPVCGSIFFSSPVISTRAGPNSLSHSFSCSYLRESTMDTAKKNPCLGAYVWLSKSCCCSVS